MPAPCTQGQQEVQVGSKSGRVDLGSCHGNSIPVTESLAGHARAGCSLCWPGAVQDVGSYQHGGGLHHCVAPLHLMAHRQNSTAILPLFGD